MQIAGVVVQGHQHIMRPESTGHTLKRNLLIFWIRHHPRYRRYSGSAMRPVSRVKCPVRSVQDRLWSRGPFARYIREYFPQSGDEGSRGLWTSKAASKEDALTPHWQKLGVAIRAVELHARGTAERGPLSCVLGSDACVQA
jgi:hypothetical protein